MRYKTFYAIDCDVSALGFGCWGLGGSNNHNRAYGPTNDLSSIDALRKAYELGVNFFDTAPLYGDGHSEQLLAKALGGKRDSIVIATKVGYTSYSGNQDFTADHIIASCHQSLQRLQTDYIDVYQLHDIRYQDLRSGEVSEALNVLRKQGKIRSIGFTCKSQKECMNIINEYDFDITQVNFNLLDQRADESGLMDMCAQNNCFVLAKTPLCFGFLTGEYSSDPSFHDLDHRKTYSKHQIDRWLKGANQFRIQASNMTDEKLLSLALRFCTSNRCVGSTLSGMLTVQQVEENVQAVNCGPLDDSLCELFRHEYQGSEFYVAE